MRILMSSVLILGLSIAVQADPILSNLPGAGTGTGTNLGIGTDTADRTKAVGLTMGGTAMDFESVVALISNGTPASTLSGGIHASTGGNPGAQLAAFTPVAIGANAAAAEVALTVAGGFTLQANTSYWFVLDGPASTNSLLWQTLSPNVAPVASLGASFDGYRFSSNGGTSWASSSLFNGVTVNVVPEPASLALLALGGLMTLRRR